MNILEEKNFFFGERLCPHLALGDLGRLRSVNVYFRNQVDNYLRRRFLVTYQTRQPLVELIRCISSSNNVIDESYKAEYVALNYFSLSKFILGLQHEDLFPIPQTLLERNMQQRESNIDQDVDLLLYMIEYCERNRDILIKLFNMNFQPVNPGDWFQLYDRSNEKQRLLLYMRHHLSAKPWLQRFLVRVDNKINF